MASVYHSMGHYTFFLRKHLPEAQPADMIDW